MTGVDAPDSFIDKWRLRWPEWRVADVFVPGPQRRGMSAWFALLQEFGEAGWGGSDPAPGLAKLAWWQEELQGWARGARRHPLGEILQRRPLPWTPLARALNVLPGTRGQAPSLALAAIEGLAAAAADCERALFATPPGREEAGDAGDAMGIALLGERALLTGAHEEAGWLLQRWPGGIGGPRPRRIHAALLRARLSALAAGQGVQPVPAWRVLPTAWRAARGR